jgi:hypothetical protein
VSGEANLFDVEDARQLHHLVEVPSDLLTLHMFRRGEE